MAKHAKNALEAQLTALTQEFVAKLVGVIRNASLSDVATFSTPDLTRRSARGPKEPASSRLLLSKSNDPGTMRVRQTAARRAELGERIVLALQAKGTPLGVRDLSAEVGVAADLLSAPLRELRANGRIHKQGEKRSTTYSAR